MDNRISAAIVELDSARTSWQQLFATLTANGDRKNGYVAIKTDDMGVEQRAFDRYQEAKFQLDRVVNNR